SAHRDAGQVTAALLRKEPPAMPTATATPPAASARPAPAKQPKPLPAPNSDFYQFAQDLPAEELAVLKKVRAYMEAKVQPIINKYWVEDAFPFELLPSFKDLGIVGLGINGYGCPGGSRLLGALVGLEIARTDVSFCTFYGVHSGLAMGSI